MHRMRELRLSQRWLKGFLSSGTWHRVFWYKFTNVSEDLTVLFINVAWRWRKYVPPKSWIIFYQITRRQILEDSLRHRPTYSRLLRKRAVCWLEKNERRKCGNLHDRERFNFCSSRNGIRVTESIRMEWVGRDSSMGEMKGTWGNLVEEPEVINWEIML